MGYGVDMVNFVTEVGHLIYCKHMRQKSTPEQKKDRCSWANEKKKDLNGKTMVPHNLFVTKCPDLKSLH